MVTVRPTKVSSPWTWLAALPRSTCGGASLMTSPLLVLWIALRPHMKAAPAAAAARPAPIITRWREDESWERSSGISRNSVGPQPTGNREFKFLRSLPIFQDVDEATEPGVGLVAVHDAVVDGQSHVSHRPGEDRVLPVDLPHDDALLQLADAEDCRLPLVQDDRCSEQRSGHAVV